MEPSWPALTWHWLNTNAGGVQAVAAILSFLALLASVVVTVFLVLYTRRYVALTKTLAEAANEQLLSREEARRTRRRELESLVRLLLNTLEPLEVYGALGREALEGTMRSSKGLDRADLERLPVLAAGVDDETARRAQALKQDLTWINERIAEVKAHRSGFGEDPWTGRPSVSAAQWNDALLSSKEALLEMLKRLA